MSGSLIVSGCSTPMTGPSRDEAFYMLAFRAVSCALERASLDPGDVDFAILSSYDALDGRMISNMYSGMASAGFLKYESRVSDDGTLALAYADALIRGNKADIGLVVGYSPREADTALLSLMTMDPFIYRPVGLNHLVQLALQASSYIGRLGLTSELWDLIAASIVSMERSAASRNPRAHLRAPLEAGEAIQGDYVVWPLRRDYIPPETRGAVALVVASREAARKHMLDRAVEVKAIRWYTDSYYLGYSKLLYALPPLARAAREAYRDADIGDPKSGIDLYEISDVTPAHYLMELEALGVAPPGRAARLLERGDVGPEAPIVVNRSGGSLSTDPYPASGLLKVYEAYLQLTGDAGPLQLEKAERALVHGYSYLSGFMGQTHSVVILEG